MYLQLYYKASDISIMVAKDVPHFCPPAPPNNKNLASVMNKSGSDGAVGSSTTQHRTGKESCLLVYQSKQTSVLAVDPAVAHEQVEFLLSAILEILKKLS